MALGCLALLALVPLVWSSVQGDREPPSLAPFELTAEETRLARDLADHEIARSEAAHSHDRVYFIKADLLPDTQANSSMRKVMVTHYRYEGDETLLSFVDLNSHEVYRVEKHQHLPTALAPEEAARAEQLVRANAELADLFRQYGNRLRVQVRPFGTVPDQPQFGHRNAQVLFKVGGEYLADWSVTVDLTDNWVCIGKFAR